MGSQGSDGPTSQEFVDPSINYQHNHPAISASHDGTAASNLNNRSLNPFTSALFDTAEHPTTTEERPPVQQQGALKDNATTTQIRDEVTEPYASAFNTFTVSSPFNPAIENALFSNEAPNVPSFSQIVPPPMPIQPDIDVYRLGPWTSRGEAQREHSAPDISAQLLKSASSPSYIPQTPRFEQAPEPLEPDMDMYRLGPWTSRNAVQREGSVPETSAQLWKSPSSPSYIPQTPLLGQAPEPLEPDTDMYRLGPWTSRNAMRRETSTPDTSAQLKARSNIPQTTRLEQAEHHVRAENADVPTPVRVATVGPQVGNWDTSGLLNETAVSPPDEITAQEPTASEQPTMRKLRGPQVSQGTLRMEFENPLVCSTCDMAFADEESLSRHVKMIHSKPAEMKCPICDMPIKNKYNMERHVKIVHPPNAKFSCEICKIPFDGTKTLALHKLHKHGIELIGKGRGRRKKFTHSSGPNKTIKKYKCGMCKYSSDWKRNVDRHHLAVHIKVKKYQCEVCKRRFGTNDNLKVHKCRKPKDVSEEETDEENS